MAESMVDVSGLSRTDAYVALEAAIRAALGSERDEVARMATIACLVHFTLGNLWTGFYRVVSSEQLKVGPYQGALGCLDIEVGRGVCGAAALQRATVVVPDVNDYPGHIACDARSRSEIVVPVFDAKGALIAVLDLDSEHVRAYDDVDRMGLEAIVRIFAED